MEGPKQPTHTQTHKEDPKSLFFQSVHNDPFLYSHRQRQVSAPTGHHSYHLNNKTSTLSTAIASFFFTTKHKNRGTNKSPVQIPPIAFSFIEKRFPLSNPFLNAISD